MWNPATRRVLLFLSASLALCMWFYVDRIWGPQKQIHYSDLYPRWYGSQQLLLHGRDPYGPEVSKEIQVWSYGRPVAPGELKDEDRFAYPVFVAFLLGPTVVLPFPQVVSLFRWVLPIAALISVPLWIKMLRWKCDHTVLGCLTLLSFGSFQVLESVYLQNLVLLGAVFLAGAGASLGAGRLALAGVLLALSTIKPQLSILLVPWLLLWATGDWQRRKALLWGFGLTIAVLVAASQILLPTWIPEFLSGILAYQRYTGNFSILRLFFGSVGGSIAGLLLVAIFMLLAWSMRKKSLDSREFLVVCCIALIVTVVTMPTLYPTNQVVLLPAVFFVLREWNDLSRAGRPLRLALFASSVFIAWPWLGTLILMAARIYKPANAIRNLWLFPVSSILLVPISLLIVFVMLSPLVFESLPMRRRAAAITHAGIR